jgi:hypothetical protein
MSEGSQSLNDFEVQVAVLAERIERGQAGALSIVNIFSGVSAEQFPAMHAECVFLARIQYRASHATGGSFRAKLRFVDEDGNSVFELRDDILLIPPPTPAASVVWETVIELKDLPFEKEGEYFLELYVGPWRMCSVLCRASLVPPSNPAVSGTGAHPEQ